MWYRIVACASSVPIAKSSELSRVHRPHLWALGETSGPEKKVWNFEKWLNIRRHIPPDKSYRDWSGYFVNFASPALGWRSSREWSGSTACTVLVNSCVIRIASSGILCEKVFQVSRTDSLVFFFSVCRVDGDSRSKRERERRRPETEHESFVLLLFFVLNLDFFFEYFVSDWEEKEISSEDLDTHFIHMGWRRIEMK